MNGSCVIGLCEAAARTTEAASAMALDAASAAVAASDAASAAAGGDNPVAYGVFAVMLCLFWAQWRTRRVVTRYGQALVANMGIGSQHALGEQALGRAATWSAEALLSAMETQRRRVIAVLIAVVALFSTVAALVLWIGMAIDGMGGLSTLRIGASLFLFASFSAPVVLLGVSASNFKRLFWTYFAPAAFASTAVLVIVTSIDGQGFSRHDALIAIGTVVTLTVAWVLVRDRTPVRLRRLHQAWKTAHPVQNRLLNGLLALGAFIGLAGPLPEAAYEKAMLGILVGGLIIYVCHSTLVDRTQRIVAPLLALGYLAAIVGAIGAGALAQTLLQGQNEWVLGLTLVGAALAGGWLMRRVVLAWIGLAYDQKVFSDAQFQVFSWMLTLSGLFICAHAMSLSEALNDVQASTAQMVTHLWLLVATALALGLYWGATRYLIRPLHCCRRLLVLRVFSKARRGERLLDELEYRWRFIGPIMLIGGADVAQRTIDPGEAAHYLGGRMTDIFLPNVDVLDKRIAGMDEAPDPDGRYRVNEFFCFDDLWRQAVQRMLALSDAVVLDLTEFDASRQGTTYELGLLRERGALARTVLLISEATDLEAVRVALHLPVGTALPAGNVIHVDGVVDGSGLVEALVRNMAPTPLPTDRPAGRSASAD